MSIWSRIIGSKYVEDKNNVDRKKIASAVYDASHYALVDIEVGLQDHKIHDIGALRYDDAAFHKASKYE